MLLLSLFGQVIASGLNYCKMEKEDIAQNCANCMLSMDIIQEQEAHAQEHSKEYDDENNMVECTQDCECCLGPYSFGTPMPLKFLPSSQISLIKEGYQNPCIISRTESLYRPPITC